MISQQELQKLAERCGHNPMFRWGDVCPVCYYFASDDPQTCCAFCAKYPNCKRGQEWGKDTCKGEADEETAKREKVPTPA